MARIAPWQWLVFALSAMGLIWSLAGLVANPDFAIGADATSVRVLGVDFNGWHAVAGFLIYGPGVVIFRRPELAFLYTWVATIGNLVTAIWAMFTDRPAWVFYFTKPTSDIVLHVVLAMALAAALLLRYRDVKVNTAK